MSDVVEEIIEVAEVIPPALVCPECGAAPPSTIHHEPLAKAWLGSHRKREHGVLPAAKPTSHKKKSGPTAGVNRERRRGAGGGPAALSRG